MSEPHNISITHKYPWKSWPRTSLHELEPWGRYWGPPQSATIECTNRCRGILSRRVLHHSPPNWHATNQTWWALRRRLISWWCHPALAPRCPGEPFLADRRPLSSLDQIVGRIPSKWGTSGWLETNFLIIYRGNAIPGAAHKSMALSTPLNI